MMDCFATILLREMRESSQEIERQLNELKADMAEWGFEAWEPRKAGKRENRDIPFRE